ERVYNTEELVELMKEVATEAIGEMPYVHSKVAGWNNAIIEGCLKRLKEKNKKHKYVVTCVIMQKKGSGFYAGSSVFWDNENDGKHPPCL
ncbi:Tctex-1, partial [Sporodiniella umbellata]